MEVAPCKFFWVQMVWIYEYHIKVQKEYRLSTVYTIKYYMYFWFRGEWFVQFSPMAWLCIKQWTRPCSWAQGFRDLAYMLCLIDNPLTYFSYMMPYLSISLLLVQVVALLLRSCHKVKGGSTGQLITEDLCGLPMLEFMLWDSNLNLSIYFYKIFSLVEPFQRNKLNEYGLLCLLKYDFT